MIAPQINRLDLNGLGGMTDAQATAVGHQLATASQSEIQTTLAALAPDDRQKVVVTYLAAGGDPRKLQAAASAIAASSKAKWLVPALIGLGVLAAGGATLALLRKK